MSAPGPYRYAQAASSVGMECSGVSTKTGVGLADLVDEDVVLGQVSMHQVALLVELAHEQHQLRIERLLLLQRHLGILHPSTSASTMSEAQHTRCCMLLQQPSVHFATLLTTAWGTPNLRARKRAAAS